MKQIIGLEAHGIFTNKNKLYFYEEKNSEQKFFEYDFVTRKQIGLDEYLLLRFGIAYPKILEKYGLQISLNLLSVKLKDGAVITHFFQGSSFYKFDKDGEILWETEELSNFDTVYGITIEGNSIWCAFPTNHTIKRYSLETFKEEITIGDKEPWSFKAEIFDHPEDVLINDNILYVTDMGNRRICKVNLTTFEIQDHKNFEEPVFGFWICEDKELAWLESGLYLV